MTTYSEWWAMMRVRWSLLSLANKLLLVVLAPVVIPIFAIGWMLGTALAITDRLIRG